MRGNRRAALASARGPWPHSLLRRYLAVVLSVDELVALLAAIGSLRDRVLLTGGPAGWAAATIATDKRNIAFFGFVAVPNLWRAKQRSAQKRTMADMRTIATAWEARATDTNTYAVATAQSATPGAMVCSTPE
jgi:hypothetical protein